MRLLTLLICLAAPAHAWEFSADPLCTIRDAQKGVTTEVIYDPRNGHYSLTMTDSAGWGEATIFGIRFDGARSFTIQTDRQRIEGNRLTVSDTGFGNVLDGLEFSTTATPFLSRERPLSLVGAAEAVRAFRACVEGGLA